MGVAGVLYFLTLESESESHKKGLRIPATHHKQTGKWVMVTRCPLSNFHCHAVVDDDDDDDVQ